MKYCVSYECRSGEKVFHGSFEINRQEAPKHTEPSVIELALKDSVRFIQAGIGGLKIIDITSKEEIK